MRFIVEGVMGLKGGNRRFSKKVEAPSERAARDKVLALIGSTHGLKRSRIRIEKVEGEG